MCCVVFLLFHYNVHFFSPPPPHLSPYLPPPFFLYICEVKTIVGADALQIMQTIKQLQ